MQLATPVVHIEQTSPRQLHFLCQQRLSLQPSAKAMIEGRETLAKLLDQLSTGDDMALSATLITDDTSAYDVQKVLFHNVGNTHFNHLCSKGLTFRRQKRKFPENFSYAYHHRYDMVPLNLETPDRPADLSFKLDQLKTTTRVAEIWNGAKFAKKGAPLEPIQGNFMLRIAIRADHKCPGLTNIVRPLIDGIVASLSSDPRPMKEEVLEHLSIETGRSLSTVKLMLHDTTYCPLGHRQLVQPFRDTVKWNPDDQRCQEAHITWQPLLDGKKGARIKVWIEPSA